jgi:hypothetical protein
VDMMRDCLICIKPADKSIDKVLLEGCWV